MIQLQPLPDTVPITSFSPFPCALSHDSWTRLPTWVKACIQTNEASSRNRPWAILTASDYMRFSCDGNRTDFESKYFSRREKVIDLTLGFCLQRDELCLNELIDGVFLLCEESGWQLPAHNGYIRDGELYPLPDNTRPVIDLFAAETGALLGLVYYLIQDSAAQFPLVFKRIEQEVEKRILAPFLQDHFWWMGNGDEPMCNWTPWCCQNVLLATLLLPFEGLQRQVINRVIYALNCFLKDYQEDGACNEGVAYYRHAALCFSNCVDILNQVCGDYYRDIFSTPTLVNMANFITKNHISGRWYFNFADSSPLLDACDVREYHFATLTHSRELMSHALMDWHQSVNRGEKRRLANEYSLYYQLQGAFLSLEMHEQCDVMLNKGSTTIEDTYYPSIGQFISRDRRFCMSVKGGANDDNHNHNDVGNIIVYRDAKPVLIDIGVGTYTKKTFSSERYDIWTMQSAWHNLPTINGVMQSAGADFCATLLNLQFSEQANHVSFDITNAYPKEAGVRRWIRNVTHRKNQNIEINEVVDIDGEATLSLILAEKPVISSNKIELPNCTIKFFSDVHLQSERVAIEDSRLAIAWSECIYRVLVQLNTPSLTWCID